MFVFICVFLCACMSVALLNLAEFNYFMYLKFWHCIVGVYVVMNISKKFFYVRGWTEVKLYHKLIYRAQ